MILWEFELTDDSDSSPSVHHKSVAKRSVPTLMSPGMGVVKTIHQVTVLVSTFHLLTLKDGDDHRTTDQKTDEAL